MIAHKLMILARTRLMGNRATSLLFYSILFYSTQKRSMELNKWGIPISWFLSIFQVYIKEWTGTNCMQNGERTKIRDPSVNRKKKKANSSSDRSTSWSPSGIPKRRKMLLLLIQLPSTLSPACPIAKSIQNQSLASRSGLASLTTYPKNSLKFDMKSPTWRRWSNPHALKIKKGTEGTYAFLGLLIPSV